jgi:dihydropteroate synthase
MGRSMAQAIILANGKTLEFIRPLIMGVANCTPDSFAVRHETTAQAVAAARRMIDDGADIIDIGGESSRPGSDPVSVDDELARVLPVLEGIRSASDIPISIDTTKAVVAQKALTAGADIINDISALAFDDGMASVAARHKCPVVLMHIKGRPKTMQKNPHYDDVINEVMEYFDERLRYAVSHGIELEKIILDVGIGFGKRREDNLALIKHLDRFRRFDRPLLVGASRKRFIGDLTGEAEDGRMPGSVAIGALAVQNGADILRVHDVAETKQAVAMATAVREA